MTTDQRGQLRDYVSAVGISGNPVLLKILAEVEDDFELLKVCVIGDIFDGKTPRQTSRFLRERGIRETDIVKVFGAVLADVQLRFVHGSN